ncbi:MAG: cytochrome-c oxidase, cbb3-type subunit III [Oxalobacteraceae bacterium]|nr:MAG: cytochrome-c oxidase, cbb3-type subunit III [Oxalobacteraceae bacterium]
MEDETATGSTVVEQNKGTVDPVTGVSTTAHSWDGITELNNPLPRWWLWLFIMTTVWAIGYWVVYPAWPLVQTNTAGLLNWTSRGAVTDELAALKLQRALTSEKLVAASLDEIRASPDLMTLAFAQGRVAFADNCAGCHGAGGAGVKGYPNLNDDDWLWGGSLGEIEKTIRFGARSTHDQGHQGTMPAFGRDGILSRADTQQVAAFVRSLSGLPQEAPFDADAGARIYSQNCAACHGNNGSGNKELGAPNLRDQIWLYGSDIKTIAEGVWNGRGSVMPAWSSRLDDATIKALTVYVHSLGGGK